MRRFIFLTAFALVAVACDGDAAVDDVASLEGTGTTVASDQTAEEVSTEEALLEFSACMREQGVDMADPTVDADGNVQIQPPQGAGAGADFDFDEIQPAFEECQSFLEDVTLGFQDADLTELQDDLLEFAACMRDNGYDMDDPDLSAFGAGGGGGGDGPPAGGPFGEIDQDDPAFQAASAACQDILAGVGFGPGGGARGGGG